MKRIELACHTGYSRMKGIGLASDWVEFAKNNNISTLVITDCGNVDSYVDIQAEIRKRDMNLKLIMGADLLVRDDRQLDGIIARLGRLSVLIRNETGKKNLYKILSEGERKYKNSGKEEALIPLSFILENKEGLLIGSGAENGLLKNSLYEEWSDIFAFDDECDKAGFDKNIFDFLDYVEVPIEGFPEAWSSELIEIAEYLEIPAVVTGAPYYMTENESAAYAILNGRKQTEDKHYHTDKELMEMFAFLGEEKAKEIIVTNSNLIADMCEMVPAVPDKKLYPYVDGQNEILREICMKALQEKYSLATAEVSERLEWELSAIEKTNSAFMFIQVRDVINRLELMPFEVGTRGLVSSSLVAYLCGITEIDPIKAKFSPYFFYGYNGGREPDIDINVRPAIQDAFVRELSKSPGVGSVVRVGILCTISKEYAEKIINEYCDKNKMNLSGQHRDSIEKNLLKCVKKRERHPGGVVMLPVGIEAGNIFPVTFVESNNGNYEVCSFEYYTIDSIAYKLDVLTNDSNEIIKQLYDSTGINPGEISIEDADVMELFKWHGDNLPACAGIPEFSSEHVLNAVKLSDVQCFDDLVRILALMHGTGTWQDNAKELIKDEIISISQALSSRDDVFDFLIEHGFSEKKSYEIAEDVRKGKLSRGRFHNLAEWEMLMYVHDIPDWFTGTCVKIGYMFPRAHAYSYMLNSWRMAWYKLHYPVDFFAAMLNTRGKKGFDADFMAYGKEKFNNFREFLESDYVENADRAKAAKLTCMILSDYYDNGLKFDIAKNLGADHIIFSVLDRHTIGVGNLIFV